MISFLKKITNVIIMGIVKTASSFSRILSRGRKSGIKSISTSVCQALETKNEYVSFQIKPKNTAEIPILEGCGLHQSHSFAILLQGPICMKDDMTFNSILFYKKTYPNAKIILSTWKDESKEQIDRMTSLGVFVITSEKPMKRGRMNINLQLTSSLEGIKKAKELECEFAVKTRTDQRICKPYIFDTMISLVRLCPSAEGQTGRIVTLGYPSGGMFIPYQACDYLYLGFTDDLIKLFSAPFDARQSIDDNERHYGTLLTRYENAEQMHPPEIYILKHYCMDVLGTSGEETVREYWRIMKDYLISFGMKDIDLLWDKYNGLYDLNMYSSAYYDDDDSPERLGTMCFDFFNWLNLYVGNLQWNESYEKYGQYKDAAHLEKS